MEVIIKQTGKPAYLNRPVRKLYPLEIRSCENETDRNAEGVEIEDNDGEFREEVEEGEEIEGVAEGVVEDRRETSLARRPRRAAALDARWRNRIMLEP